MTNAKTDSAPPRRNTKQRAAIVNALSEIDDFRSAQQIHDLLLSRGETVGLTTVYRGLQALAADSTIDVIVTEDGESQYRLCSTGHHHHLVCRNCGTTVEIEGPSVERWANRIAAENGFTAPDHTIEITGLCPTCSAAGR